MDTVRRGLLLLAHGSRDARWGAPFEAVVAHVRAQAPALEVALAFLERMAPTGDEAAAQLAARGCECVDVVPLFLGAGGHVRGDLPELLARWRATHPSIDWRLRAAVGEAPEVVAALADAALRLVREVPPAA